MQSEREWPSAELLARVAAGDSTADDEIFARYVERLTRLAQARLSPRLAARTDPEDVVLSAWRSFFVAARAGDFTLRRSGDLWRLLASITMHKLHRRVRFHLRRRRSVTRETAIDAVPDELLSDLREPQPDEVAALADEVQAIMALLDPFVRRVFELRLQGEPIEAIAKDTARSERTVRRALSELRAVLARRLEVDA